MKKTAYIFWLALVILIGCQKRAVVDGATADFTPIRLTSGVWGVVGGRAPVVLGERFMAEVCGWQGVTTAVDWTIAPTWTSSADILARATALDVALVPSQLYNNKGQLTVVRAWHPAGKLEQGKVLFDNPTAGIDVMLTPSVSGSVAAPISAPLLFSHLTTQFRFVLVDSDWYTDEPVLSLRINAARVPVGIDLSAGGLVSGVAAALEIPGVGGAGVLPTRTGVAFGRAVMVLPVDGNKFTVAVQTRNKNYPAIEVTTPDTRFAVGKLYTVTLTLSGGRGISVGSQVGEWPLESQTQVDLL